MGLFDKKYCDICGNKIGLLGNRKLADGNLCKDCAKKLSPWFTERKQSTVEDIKEQLSYREENQKRANQFHPNITLGESKKLMIDTADQWFTVTDGDPAGENADIVSFRDFTGIDTDISEYRRQIYYKDKDGKQVSYNPPRYEYDYNFYVIIHVNTPYFNEMKFQINSMSVTISDNGTGSLLGRSRNTQRYDQYRQMQADMKKALTDAVQMGDSSNGNASIPVTNPDTFTSVQSGADTVNPAPSVWTCPYCGKADNSGKFCENCGAPKP